MVQRSWVSFLGNSLRLFACHGSEHKARTRLKNLDLDALRQHNGISVGCTGFKVRGMPRPLPIGISDFKKVIEGNYAYVDKTLFIQELIERGTDVALIPRPRRFGKTLNLSMLRYFFEKTSIDTSYLFKSLSIWKSASLRGLQGQYPVVFLSLKDIKHATWIETLTSFRRLIGREYERHRYILEGGLLTIKEKQLYSRILDEEDDQPLHEASLLLLTEWLQRYHEKRVILLVDEYDTPAHASFIGGYYDKLIAFLRNWLSGGLKDNSALERGLLTGILRVAKESIFSGLNNVKTFTVLDEGFQDKFGLLEAEVAALAEEYQLVHRLRDMREWYNGYRIGSCEGLYNPWSVLNCLHAKGALAPHWVNTSDNALMKRLLLTGGEEIKISLEELLCGKIIAKNISEGIVFADLEKSPNAVWSLLLFSGYLTIRATPVHGAPLQLKIPNIEVAELYQSAILEWFESTIHGTKYYQLLESLVNGDIETFSLIFQEFLLSALSAFDIPAETPEMIYHAFVLGMLLGLKDRYEVKSNRESGYGRYDVLLIPKNNASLGIIMEFKKVSPFAKMGLKEAVASALQQIEDRQYKQELIDRGVKNILYVGMAFDRKHVLIDSTRPNK